MSALWRYHSCSKANTPNPRSRSHACHRQNWFFPPRVRSSNSTPLFANNKHIPDSIPEAEAYEIARNNGTRELGPLDNAKVEDVVIEGDLELDFLTIRGVVSVMT